MVRVAAGGTGLDSGGGDAAGGSEGKQPAAMVGPGGVNIANPMMGVGSNGNTEKDYAEAPLSRSEYLSFLTQTSAALSELWCSVGLPEMAELQLRRTIRVLSSDAVPGPTAHPVTSAADLVPNVCQLLSLRMDLVYSRCTQQQYSRSSDRVAAATNDTSSDDDENSSCIAETLRTIRKIGHLYVCCSTFLLLFLLFVMSLCLSLDLLLPACIL